MVPHILWHVFGNGWKASKLISLTVSAVKRWLYLFVPQVLSIAGRSFDQLDANYGNRNVLQGLGRVGFWDWALARWLLQIANGLWVEEAFVFIVLS